jgi:hypothetical protein
MYFEEQTKYFDIIGSFNVFYADVLISCVHPGTVRTDVFRHMPLPVRIIISTVFRVLTKVKATFEDEFLSTLQNCTFNFIYPFFKI